MGDESQDFPLLHQHDYQRLAGPYPHSLVALSSIAEYLFGDLQFWICSKRITIDYQGFGLERRFPLLIQTKLHLVDLDRADRNPILCFYCQCLSEAQKSSTCFHVFAICWFLSQEQYKEFSALTKFLNFHLPLIPTEYEDDNVNYNPKISTRRPAMRWKLSNEYSYSSFKYRIFLWFIH